MTLSEWVKLQIWRINQPLQEPKWTKSNDTHTLTTKQQPKDKTNGLHKYTQIILRKNTITPIAKRNHQTAVPITRGLTAPNHNPATTYLKTETSSSLHQKNQSEIAENDRKTQVLNQTILRQWDMFHIFNPQRHDIAFMLLTTSFWSITSFAKKNKNHF